MERRFFDVLETRGAPVAAEAKQTLLENVQSSTLKAALHYVTENWHDPLKPTLISLACEAVGGNTELITPVAIALSLLGLSLNIWNDIADRVKYRRFIPTFPQRLGTGQALIIAGLATAKAYYVLSRSLEATRSQGKYRRANELFRDFACKMGEAEALNFALRRQMGTRHPDKLDVFKMRSVHLRICMEAGALEGGSHTDVAVLAEYGSRFGMILELREDVQISLNQTLELVQKIQSGSFPYTVRWMMDHSDEAQTLLSSLVEQHQITPIDIKNVVGSLFSTGAIDHVINSVKKLGDEASHELLRMEENEATRLLRFLIQAQHPLTIRNLWAT